jgi:hypothetical protein
LPDRSEENLGSLSGWAICRVGGGQNPLFCHFIRKKKRGTQRGDLFPGIISKAKDLTDLPWPLGRVK